MNRCDGCGIDKGRLCTGCLCWPCFRLVEGRATPAEQGSHPTGMPREGCPGCAKVRADVRRARLGPRVGDRVRRVTADATGDFDGTLEAVGEGFQAQVCWGDGRREGIARDAIESERQGAADRGSW